MLEFCNVRAGEGGGGGEGGLLPLAGALPPAPNQWLTCALDPGLFRNSPFPISQIRPWKKSNQHNRIRLLTKLPGEKRGAQIIKRERGWGRGGGSDGRGGGDGGLVSTEGACRLSRLRRCSCLLLRRPLCSESRAVNGSV